MHKTATGSLRDRIAAFEKQGAVPAPKASFGSAVPLNGKAGAAAGGGRGLYGNRIGGVKRREVSRAPPEQREAVVTRQEVTVAKEEVKVAKQEANVANDEVQVPTEENVVTKEALSEEEDEEEYPVHEIQQVQEIPSLSPPPPPPAVLISAPPSRHEKHLSRVVEVDTEVMKKVLQSLEEHEQVLAQNHYDESMSMDISQTSIDVPTPVLQNEEISAPAFVLPAPEPTAPLPPPRSTRLPKYPSSLSLVAPSASLRHIRSTSSPTTPSAPPPPPPPSFPRSNTTTCQAPRRAVTPTPVPTYTHEADFSFDAPDLLDLIQAAATLEERLTHPDSPLPTSSSSSSYPSLPNPHDPVPPPPSSAPPQTHKRMRSRKRSFRDILNTHRSVSSTSTSTSSSVLENPPMRKSSLSPTTRNHTISRAL